MILDLHASSIPMILNGVFYYHFVSIQAPTCKGFVTKVNIIDCDLILIHSDTTGIFFNFKNMQRFSEIIESQTFITEVVVMCPSF